MEYQIGNLICTFSNPLVGAIKSRIVSGVGATSDELEKEYWLMTEFTQTQEAIYGNIRLDKNHMVFLMKDSGQDYNCNIL